MKELCLDEVNIVDGASSEGANVVIAAATAGAIAGGIAGAPIFGVGAIGGAVVGGLSAGIHAFVLWQLAN